MLAGRRHGNSQVFVLVDLVAQSSEGNPEISSRGLPGFFAYDERADRRSWSAMLALLYEAFA